MIGVTSPILISLHMPKTAGSSFGLALKRESRQSDAKGSNAPQLRNLYSKFLWSFPITRFSFIGISEHYDQELDRFASSVVPLGRNPTSERVNENPKQTVRYVDDEQQRGEIERIHATDMALYQQACRIRLASIADQDAPNE